MAAACLALTLVFAQATISLAAQLPAPHADQRMPKMDLRKMPPGTRVNVEAGQFTYDSNTRVGVATGDVVLTYGPYLLVGTRVTYDQDDDIMRAEGQIHMREPNGNILSGDLIELQNKFRDGFAEHLRMLLTNDATVRAEYAKRSEGNITVFTRATYTRCKTCVLKEGTPLWQIRSAEARHVETDHRVYHRDATFEFAGVPILYTPYFSHPDGTLENQSGFLTPNLSRSSSVYGWGLTVPYLWSLDPSYDVTLMPMITSEHGIMPRAEWRQRTKSGQYSVEAAIIHEDNDLDWRSYARAIGLFDLNKRWSWGFDVTAQSDDTFARNYKINDDRVVTNQIFLTGIDDRDYFSARAMSFRNLVLDNDDEQPVAAPYVQHSFTLDREVFGGEVGVESSFYRVTRDQFLDRTDDPLNLFQSTGQTRATSTVHWQRREANSLGTLLTPFTMVRADVYQTDALPDYMTPSALDTEDGDVVGRLLPTAGLDIRWPFVNSTGHGDHVLTPVAQIVSSANETKRDRIGNEDSISVNFDINSLFLSDRFTGLDRHEGGTRVNTGLLYNFLAPQGGFLRASLGQSFHIAGDNSFTTGAGLENNKSDIVAGFALQPWRALQMSYQLRMEDQNFNVHAQEATLQARFDRVTLRGGYAELESEEAYGRTDREQQMWADGSATIYGPWSLFGGAHYDVERSTMIRDYVGVGFDCDCLNAKFYYTEDYDTTSGLRKDRSLLFSVDLKTLGSSKTISPF
ncbi:MAG: LPS assembly protein LptD [Aestuariivirgaceae bacterium]|nr:LPS assembly protein LptD [Aestuariivirgaceae bacterium]